MIYTIENHPIRCPECNRESCKHIVETECRDCKKVRKVQFKQVAKPDYQFRCHGCCRIGRKISEEHREKIRKALTGRSLSEEHKQKVSESLKGQILSKERRENISKALKKSGAKISKKVLESYASGKRKAPGGPKASQIWMRYADGTRFWVQGTYEQRYAQSLLDNNVEFVAHPKSLSYVDKNGKKRTYFPDFFITQNNEYIDVKSEYTLELAGDSYFDKIEKVMKQNNVIVQTIVIL